LAVGGNIKNDEYEESRRIGSAIAAHLGQVPKKSGKSYRKTLARAENARKIVALFEADCRVAKRALRLVCGERDWCRWQLVVAK
jgi:hypothetical protein